jgi:ABC-type Fe3+/spermidine/putrescine transport system ATPase subunit
VLPVAESGAHVADVRPHAVVVEAADALQERMLVLSGISKLFGAVRALSEVDLAIGEGEFVTLLGPSGCGKTTLLRIIAGFEQASAGKLTFRSVGIGRLPPERRPFKLVFQSYALFPHMSVFDNVAYGLRVAKVADADMRRRVTASLEMVGMAGMFLRRPKELSGGQQQRVALARALVTEPEVLLLDEPLGALDLQLRKRMQTELRLIQHRLGTAFVYVTHAQDEALTMSDRVVLMDHGRINQVGSPREIYSRPETRFCAEFVGDTSLLPCRVLGDDGEAAAVEVAGGRRASFRYYGARLKPGEQALVSLRPEDLLLTGADEGLLKGRVGDVVFRGDGVRLEVEVEGGRSVKVDVRGDVAVAPGIEVGISVRPEAGVVVRDDVAMGTDSGAEPAG